MFDWKTVPGHVMGILNVTPDSFSDGGLYLDTDSAVLQGLELTQAGAAMIDIGGESTRPGAEPVSAAEEMRRVIPVVEALASQISVPISIDTTKAEVAAAALAAGAAVVNDVSAGRGDPSMFSVVAESGAGYIVMHMLGEPRTMQDDPRYGDVVRDVGDFLFARIKSAHEVGIAECSLMADPGIGFGKTFDQNLSLLARLGELISRVRVPMLVGTSRKGFLGHITGVEDPAARDDATLATVVWALQRGASMVRVHDVKRAVHAAAVLDALRGAEPKDVGAVA